MDAMRRFGVERGQSETLVIHCSDPRFQTAFRRFITEILGIRNYAPIAIGGGVHALGVPNTMPENYKSLWAQIEFFIAEGQFRQVIIINHEDCRWYRKMEQYETKTQPQAKGILDLQTAASIIRNGFPEVTVRAFWAALDNDTVSFTEVTDG
jgi:carbonic anhydrase